MTAAVAEVKITARELANAIRLRYEPPEWHVEDEVTLAGRRLDLVALNMWTTRNHRIVGFEIKVSRGDWVRELDAFQKSEDWCAVVDAFYVVTPPKLIRDGELPDGWGLLELSGSRMMTRKHAAVREGVSVIPREIAARFLSRMAAKDSAIEREARWHANDKLREEADARARETLGRQYEGDRKELAELRAQYDEIVKALGVERHDWEKHKHAMKAAGVFASATRGAVAIKQRLDTNAQQLEQFARQMRDASAAISDSEAP